MNGTAAWFGSTGPNRRTLADDAPRWKCHRHSGSRAGFAGDAQCSAVQLHEVLRDRQTEAGSFVLAVGIGVELAEAFKRLWDVVGRHPYALVGHGQ